MRLCRIEFGIIRHKRHIQDSLFLCIIETEQTLSVVLLDMLIQTSIYNLQELSLRAVAMCLVNINVDAPEILHCTSFRSG